MNVVISEYIALYNKVCRAKVVKPGFFSSKYDAYVVNTFNKGWTVERKYGDFVGLRKILAKLYPGYIVPGLPKRAVVNLETDAIEKMRYKLQLFLNDLLLHPLLRNTDQVEKFLLLSNNSEYEKYSSKFETTNRECDANKMVTVEGKAKFLFDKKLESSCEDTLGAMKQIKGGFSKLKTLNKSLRSDLSKVTHTMKEMAHVYREIAQSYVEAGGASVFELFTTLGDAFSKLSDSTKRLEGNVAENFDKYFRFYHSEAGAIESALAEWQNERVQTIKMDKRLLEKKELLFSEKQMDKWGISDQSSHPVSALLKNKELAFQEMLPKETALLGKLQETYGYLCNKMIEECERIWEKDDKAIRTHLLDVSKMNCSIFESVTD